MKRIITLVISGIMAFYLALLIYCFSFYIHESGHILFGFIGSVLKGKIPEFILTWNPCPCLGFLKPIKTFIMDGEPSLLFALGGPIFSMCFWFITSFVLYKNLNRKAYLWFFVIFAIHELVGNVLCGTDNVITIFEENAICFLVHLTIPALVILVFVIVFEYLSKKIDLILEEHPKKIVKSLKLIFP